MKTLTRHKGFTIIELLVVIAIIGILSGIVLANLADARAQSRDSARIALVQQIQLALEVYYEVHGYYPQILDGRGHESGCGDQTENWGHCDRLKTLTDALAPYLNVEPEELSEATNGDYYFTYASQNGDDEWQSYGLMVYLEKIDGSDDGGYYDNAYEVGSNPRYCMANYSGTDADWEMKPGVWNWRCRGGN